MQSSQSEEQNDAVLDGPVQQAIFGIAYVVVGIAFFYSLIFGSTELLMGVLLVLLVLVVLSVVLIVTREGLITPENKLIGGFVLLAIGLLFGVTTLTDLPEIVVFALVIIVGIIIPNQLLKRGDYNG
jgi:hypothetical protein